MSDLEFDREAVGVSAKSDWADSTEFARIGNCLDGLAENTVAEELPEGDNSGTAALTAALANYSMVMAWAAFEYSDACAVLGSGQQEAIGNYDDAELEATGSFEAVRARMEGEQ